MKAPAIRKRLADMGYEPVGGSAEEFAPKVQEDYNLWGGVIRAIGVKLD